MMWSIQFHASYNQPIGEKGFSCALWNESRSNNTMKKTIIGVFALLLLVGTSCSKTYDADAFVGRYSVSTVENATWGAWSGTLTDNGTLIITAISSNQIQTSGYFNTTGKVVGSKLYLESKTTSDSSGTLTIVFGTGVLDGDVLSLTSTMSGQLGENGVLYPFYSTARHTCIRQ